MRETIIILWWQLNARHATLTLRLAVGRRERFLKFFFFIIFIPVDDRLRPGPTEVRIRRRTPVTAAYLRRRVGVLIERRFKADRGTVPLQDAAVPEISLELDSGRRTKRTKSSMLARTRYFANAQTIQRHVREFFEGIFKEQLL